MINVLSDEARIRFRQQFGDDESLKKYKAFRALLIAIIVDKHKGFQPDDYYQDDFEQNLLARIQKLKKDSKDEAGT